MIVLYRLGRIAAFVLLAFACLAQAVAEAKERRVALVIGNAAYAHATALPNTANDAADISASLKRLGFEVQLHYDLPMSDLRRALHRFGRSARGADMAMIYFAGHGIEVGKRNYLIPTDARLRSNFDVDFEAVSLDLVLAAVGSAKGLRLVLLDACRNNPFASTMTLASRSRSVGRGFSRIEPNAGTLVGYAAREGTTADDGDGRNSPYARALLAHLEEPGLEVSLLFRKVRDHVLRETGGAQEPFVYGSLPGKQIYLRARPEGPVASDAERQELRQRGAWNFVKQSRNLVMLRDYVARFPNGRFRRKAEALIAELESRDATHAGSGTLASEDDAATDARRKAEIARLSGELEAEARRKVAEARARADARRRAERQRALTDWRLVRNSTDPGELEAYLSRHPASIFAGLASERLAALRRERLAVLQPQAGLPDAGTAVRPGNPLDEGELARRIQQELNRLGCKPGRPDGKWGRGSRRALQAASRHGKMRLASLTPNQDVLDTLSKYRSRICPLSCGRRKVVKGDKCVPKSCGRGKELNRKGLCVAKLDDQAKKKKLKCGPRHRLKNNRCVLKSCGRGKELDRKGRCVAKRKTDDKKVKKAAERKPRKKASSGKNCGRILIGRGLQFGRSVCRTHSVLACGARYRRAKAKGINCD